jgi:predicted transcriptional regulator of viral defense system
LAFARQILGSRKQDPTPRFLERLQSKGWIRRIRQGRFAIVPLSSGENRSPYLHEFVVAMELASPAAIAYWSALNHHGMTEQLPRTAFGRRPKSRIRISASLQGIPQYVEVPPYLEAEQIILHFSAVLSYGQSPLLS